MNDTVVTVVGNVATGVEFRESASGGVARFRFAVTGRRWDRQKNGWADGPTSFYTVWAWRTLGANLAASVSVGEPLVVHGRLRVREDEREGQRRTSVEIDAVAVGHDLTRGTAAFRRVTRATPSLTERHKSATEGEERGRAGLQGPDQVPIPMPDGTPDGTRDRAPDAASARALVTASTAVP
ncbi:single-stranded DNA-binding protein [Streptomyces scopuliridis]|uniref:Single-stranded DNA-binding protein n=1 Tax=Streptomyces scopuliridis RB72 TaxID=1440053 RepID=A0A2T7T7G8_9ACTN|nr:single-stranded DNA-binding protein [Streptomyces scopuliridis]PVE11051.1 single-stranded DNA-binding protein [Streptomyces scopuliridis RB72]